MWLPVQLGGDTLEGSLAVGLGVSKDASEGGMFISSSEPLDVGAEVLLSFTVLDGEGGSRTHTTPATIVRVAPNADDPEGLWPWRVAVRFAAPLAGLESALAEMQRELDRAK